MTAIFLASVIAFGAGILVAGYRPRVFHALDWALTYAIFVPLSAIVCVLVMGFALGYHFYSRARAALAGTPGAPREQQ